MGKGFNNYMTKKFFHPSSKDNIKRKWMAEQKTAHEKKKQEDLMAQYQKEQEVLNNRALLGDEKAKVGLSFMYDAPPGLKKKEDTEPQQEVKFEWQRKYNAPREAYAKDDETIRDQPFGIEVRNVRCIKCRQWGHVNTDKICPLFGKDLTAEPELPTSSNGSLLKSLGSEGLVLKNSILAKMVGEEDDAQHRILSEADEEDPEVKFLKSLTSKQKKKLLKKLNKLQSSSEKGISKKGKKKKKHQYSSDDSYEDKASKHKNEKRRKHKKRSSPSESADSSSSSDQKHTTSKHKKGYAKEKHSSRHREDREKSPVKSVYKDERKRSPAPSKHREYRHGSPLAPRRKEERERSLSPPSQSDRKERPKQMSSYRDDRDRSPHLSRNRDERGRSPRDSNFRDERRGGDRHRERRERKKRNYSDSD